MRNLIGLAVGLLLLASCDRPEAPTEVPPAAAFRHAMSSDLSGYYLPADDVRVGNWSFHHIFVGQAQEFQAWESGNEESEGEFSSLGSTSCNLDPEPIFLSQQQKQRF